MARIYKLSRYLQDKHTGEWIERFESYYNDETFLYKSIEKTETFYNSRYDKRRYHWWIEVKTLKNNTIKCAGCRDCKHKTQWHAQANVFLCKTCFDKENAFAKATTWIPQTDGINYLVTEQPEQILGNNERIDYQDV